MKLSDYVMDFLARQGLKHLFLLPGGGSMHLVDSAGRNSDFQYVCCLHEQACAFAAEAYAEFTQKLGAALVTTGPGGTNTVTGVAAAWMESASCLFLSGQVKRADRIADRGVRTMGPQEVDIISIVQPITKYAVTVLDPQTIRFHLEKAVHLATHGRRGPVWIDIPLDVQASIIDENSLEGFVPDPPPASDELRQQVSAAIDLLNQAQRPVLFLGNGARSAQHDGQLNKLIELLEIPVLLTWKIADLLPERRSALCGASRRHGAARRQFHATECRLPADHRGPARPSTDRFQPSQLRPRRHQDPGGCRPHRDCQDGDADRCAGLRRLPPLSSRSSCEQADRLTRKNRSCWLRRAKEWQTRYPVVLPEYWDETHSGPAADSGTQSTVNTYVLMDVLSDELTADDVLVPGSSGPCSDIFMQAFRVKPGQRIVNAPGLGAMGTGLPGSLGACLASGRKRTICVNGDGGFQLNIQDLETVRRLNLPIKYFILCNGAYASIMTSQRSYFQGRYVASEPSSALTLPDIVKVAAAYGIRTAEIQNHRDLREGVRAVLAQDGPVVCAVNVSPEQATAPRVTSAVRPDGTIVSKPMEDMWPFLDREEFLANMIIAPLEESL